ncbi:MAG TPA: hypothetical protein VGK67_40750 [Myxococcales bacterium]|jgi:hypothetical protein
MEDGKTVLAYLPSVLPAPDAPADVREALTASLRRACTAMPGSLLDPVCVRRELLAEEEPSSLCVGGAVVSPERLDRARLRAVADVVSQILDGDGFDVVASPNANE